MGATVSPMRSTDSIMWTVKFRNGTLKRFKFPIRTTPEGQADPKAGFEFDGDINDEILFNEPDCIGTDLFTLGG
jgi:adenylylsulfate reductase subunit B